MRIKKITNQYIVFNDNSVITFNHDQDCCEHNYANFPYIRQEPGIFAHDFNKNLIFENAEGGFRFGDPSFMVYVPCYSEQNGYYTMFIDVYFRGERVLDSTLCKWVYC